MSGILVLTGPPGAGKSTVAARLARQAALAVHMHTDDFYAWIVQGYVEPWTTEAREQNTVVMEAMATTAARFASGGYEVVVDGIVGPWFLDPWRAIGGAVSYAVLLPAAATAGHRAASRGEHPLKDLTVVGLMHASFVEHLRGFEKHVIDSSGLTVDETLTEVRTRWDAAKLALA